MKKFLKWFALAISIAFIVAIILNRQWLYDWFRGIGYQPTGEMSRIMAKLNLTERGEFLFKAAQPRLNSRNDFNAICRGDSDEEIAILGCYTDGNIYIYNIDAEELNEIRELTTAHELLHAVWARMPDGDKERLSNDLEKVYRDNQDILSEEINHYSQNEQREELYARAGTEIKTLPDTLEKHYAEVFNDQDLIVSYYDSYITVFKEIEAEMTGLMKELDALDQEMQAKNKEYEQKLNQLNTDITNFNSCAATEGCFNNADAFHRRRNELLAEQTALEEMYNYINQLVDAYNQKVEQYNADATRTEKLNSLINSNHNYQPL